MQNNQVSVKSMNLIEIQQRAIDGILSVNVQGKRSMAYGHTFLNRKWRGLRKWHMWFTREVSKLGFTQEQVEQQWNDVKDMAILHEQAD